MKNNPVRFFTRLTMLAASGLMLTSALGTKVCAAAYAGLRPDTFMKGWLIAGPIPVAGDAAEPDEARQKMAFADDLLAPAGGEANVRPAVGSTFAIGDKKYDWRQLDSASDVVDLKSGATSGDFVVAYAWAEIDRPEATKEMLAIGSDDGVKVWLNGKLVHEKWALRPARVDDDLVPVEFRAGTNRLLLKIQNAQGGWGFVCRLFGPAGRADKLEVAALAGEVDVVRTLLDLGADVNGRGPSGLTPLQAARLRGQAEVVAFLTTRGADPSAAMPPREAIVDRRLARLFKPEGAGAAVLVARDGRILFEHAYGRANLAQQVAATTDTQFRIGSVTKQFTAAAVLKLAETGKLSPQDKLTKFFPDFPRGDEVTIHHLLTHTSGIHSYTNKPGFLQGVATLVEPAALIASFKNDPYDFDPGQRWLYNNSGYFLLGEIVAQVSGMSYGDYLQQTFFGPLGMTATGVHAKAATIPHEAMGYSYQNGGFEKALDWDMSWAGGAGALYSTVGDLHRWNEAVFKGNLLTEASRAAAFTPVRTAADPEPGPKKSGYGYGWMMAEWRGQRVIEHGGGLNGFVSQLLRLPEHNLTVVLLVNCAPPPPGVDPGALSRDLAEIYLGTELPLREMPVRAANVSTEVLNAIAGRYDYGGPILTVTRDGDRLFAQLSGQPRFEIFPKSETTFFWKVVEAEVNFERDDQGRVTRAIHKQSGQTINAPRLPEAAVAQVDPAVFDAYVGRYDYSGGAGQAIMEITRDGDRLFAQLTGQPKFEIFPSAETEFFWKIVNAQITFVRDNDGKVVKAIHHQAGRTIDAPRVE